MKDSIITGISVTAPSVPQEATVSTISLSWIQKEAWLHLSNVKSFKTFQQENGLWTISVAIRP